MAAANIALVLALVASILWRLGARRSGQDVLGPFRRTSPLHGPVALFVLLSILSVLFSTDAIRSAREVKGLFTFLLVVLVAGLVDGVEDAHLVVDALRLATLYLVLRGLVDYFVLGYNNVWERLSGGLSIYMTYAGLLMVLSLVLAARALTAGRERRERLVDGGLAVAAAAPRRPHLHEERLSRAGRRGGRPRPDGPPPAVLRPPPARRPSLPRPAGGSEGEGGLDVRPDGRRRAGPALDVVVRRGDDLGAPVLRGRPGTDQGALPGLPPGRSSWRRASATSTTTW